MPRNGLSLADQILLDWSVKYGVGSIAAHRPYGLRMTMMDFANEVLSLDSPTPDDVTRIVDLYRKLIEWHDPESGSYLVSYLPDHEA